MARGLSALTRGQVRFARELARETKLNSRVIAAWMLAEESGGAARSREQQGNHNWLNIGYFDSGPGAITKDAPWRSPEQAAHATALFLQGRKYGASSGIRGILHAGSDPSAQIAAIGRSGWATNPAYGQNIAQLHGSIAPAVGAAPGGTSPGAPARPTAAAPTASLGAQRYAAIKALFQTHDAIGFASALGDIDAQEHIAKAGHGGGAATPTAQSGGQGGVPRSLIGAAQWVDRLAAQTGNPITARQEHGHAAGGDHDPAVKGATARDLGGAEDARKRMFLQVARALGVKNPVYKGQDINVVRNGVRYQIISRDHGTGPHLHIGMRKVS